MEKKEKKISFFQKLKKVFTTEIGSGGFKKYFFESLATMLASGIDIRTILKDLKGETKNKGDLALITRMQVAIENGTPIWRVAKDEKLVAEHYLALIRIGEMSGSLPENLDTIVTQIDRDRDFQNKLRSASLYPSLIAILLFVVVIVLMTFVFPKITGVYDSLNIELPTITKVMMAIGDFFSENAIWFIPTLFTTIFLIFYFLFMHPKTKKYGQMLMFKVPAIKGLIQELELARFGYLLNSLLRAGVTFPEALKLLVESTSLFQYKKLYEFIAYYIEKGYSMDVIMEAYPNINKLIPLYPRQLLVNGVKARKLQENALKIGEIYQKKNELTLKDIGTLFEPALLILIWIGVSIFAISVIMPMYSILGNLTDISSSSNPQQVVEEPRQDVINDVNQVK
jgi:type IV pilus assembly protein PilC